MAVSISGIDPKNNSYNNDPNVEITFQIVNCSEDQFNDLTISSAEGIIFKEKTFVSKFEESSYYLIDGIYYMSIIKSDGFSEGTSAFLKVFIPNELNYIYQIGVLGAAPYLYYSNVSNLEVITSPKKISIEFGDFYSSIDQSKVSVNFSGFDIITSGVIHPDFEGLVEISNNNFLVITMDHSEYFKNGSHYIKYSISNIAGKTLNGKINFSVKLRSLILPSIFPQISSLGNEFGISEAKNLGSGGSVKVSWNLFSPRSKKSEMCSMVFSNKNRLSLFDSLPSIITFGSTSEVTFSNLSNGVAMSFGVRGLESYVGTFSETGLIANDGGGYIFPGEIVTNETLFDNGTYISVESTEGYPDKGLLILSGSEVIKYYSKESTRFLISTNGRGLNETTPSNHPLGSSVSLFVSCQDKNTNIVTATPTYNWGNQSGRERDMVGEVVADFSADDKRFFQGYDYCGYHQALPEKILMGKDECGSYLGGEFNGLRGFNIFDRVNSRNEILLEQVGEPSILLQRKWSGEQCDCMTLRKEHPRNRTCIRCFGTGFVGGYDIYQNLRRADRKVLLRFKETKHDLDIDAKKHLNVQMSPSCWTLPIPAIKDRDIVVRFDFVNNFEYMYEVLDVTKERFVYKHYGRQNLTLQRLDKTDIIYTFKYGA
jgi:hypothetical protein